MPAMDMILSEKIIDLDEATFETMIKSTDKLIIVEFYMENCPYCQTIAPIYESLSKELGEDAVFTRVDADSHGSLAVRYGIVGTPTFKFFCRDQMIGEVLGETNETVLRNTIKDAIRHQTACSLKAKNSTYEIDGYG